MECVPAPCLAKNNLSKSTRCARIRARDFFAFDTLTIASVLPGAGANYLVPRTATECGITQLGNDYVRFSRLVRLRGFVQPTASDLRLPTVFHLSSISTNRNSKSLALMTLWATPARRAYEAPACSEASLTPEASCKRRIPLVSGTTT